MAEKHYHLWYLTKAGNLACDECGYQADPDALLDRIAALEAQDAASEHNAVQQWQTINKQNDYIATLERERAEERKQNAAAMAIVRAVAKSGGVFDDEFGYHCLFCWADGDDLASLTHDADCPVTQARALLAGQAAPVATVAICMPC